MTKSLDLSRFPGLSQLGRDADVGILPRIADLATSFPLLFFMLATDSGPFGRRLEVIRLTELGKPLAEVAAPYQLPLCLRRIPPEACIAPLPWVAWTSRAAPMLAHHIPSKPAEAGNWLPAVFHAARLCDEDFGLWIARQPQILNANGLDSGLLLPVALYAWHSRQPVNPLANITLTPWSPNYGLSRVISETNSWLYRLYLLAHCGSYPIVDTWLEPGRVDGFDFVPIDTWDGLMTERVAMRNCLHTYVDKLACGACRLFAVKAGVRSVATLEVAADRGGRLSIAQLKGPGNTHPATEVKAAVQKWAASQFGRSVTVSRVLPAGRASARLAQVLESYRQTAPPHSLTGVTVATLRDQLHQLKLRLVQAGKSPAVPPQAPVDLIDPAPVTPAQAEEYRRVHGALRARLGEEVYTSWFGRLEFEGRADGVVRVSVPVRFLRNWIERHYVDALRECCVPVWPDTQTIEVMVRPPREPAVVHLFVDPARPEGGEGVPRVMIDDIMSIVARRYNISRADILSERRHRAVVLPRQIAMYLARQMSARGLPEIGRRFGGRDHTTVLHAIRKIDRMMVENPQFRTEIDDLRRSLPVRRQP